MYNCLYSTLQHTTTWCEPGLIRGCVETFEKELGQTDTHIAVFLELPPQLKTDPYDTDLDQNNADHNNDWDDDHERLDDLGDTDMDVDGLIDIPGRSSH